MIAAPPGPFRPGFWRSPIRGRWLTAVLGTVLLVGVPMVFATGYLSYLAYNPWLEGNDTRHGGGALTPVPFHWPTAPAWGYRFTQGLHVTLGAMLVPVVLAKLWSVIPKLFTWPPVASPAQAVERLSVFLLVSSGVLTFATGLLNVQYWYRFPGSFYILHFYAAWVFVTAAAAHAVLKVPQVRAALRERPLRVELRTDLAHTEPEDDAPAGPPTISRRGALGLVASGSAAALVMMAPQAIGGPLRPLGLLSPRGGYSPGAGPNDFAVNTTATEAGVGPVPDWRLNLVGPAGTWTFSRSELLALPQFVADLPIACVEGWSTGNQRWEGVRLRNLAERAGLPDAQSLFVESLQGTGEFRRGRLAGNQIRHPDSLLALRVNGADLSLDHGFPARIVVPNNPGVRNTKWVAHLTFES